MKLAFRGIGTRHAYVAMITTLWLVVGLAFSTGAASARSQSGALRVTIITPKGVPATVVATGGGRSLFFKGPNGRRSVVTKSVSARRQRISARRISFNGRIYDARITNDRVRIRAGRISRITVRYKSIQIADQLVAKTVGRNSISLAWKAPSRATVLLRRTAGARPASSAQRGSAVPVNGRSATDSKLTAGSTYTYALFTRVKRRWVGPVTITVGTASPNPTVAAFVAPPTTVIAKSGDADTPTVENGGVSVKLAAGRATPLLGSGFVLPVSDVLPTGFLGKVMAISDDGRTVLLAGAGLAEAFSYYDINLDLSDSAPTPLAARHGARPIGFASRGKLPSGLKNCASLGADGSVQVKPTITPRGHFSSHVETGWLKLKAKFDMSVELQLGLSADFDVSGSIACGLNFGPWIKNITLYPVPIAVVFDPTVEAGATGSFSARDVGYSVTGGFWAKGELGTSNSISGGLIHSGGPTATNTFFALALDLKLGGELTVGPGAGSKSVGAVAGVGGELYPLKASFGPIFPQGDPRRSACLKTSAALEAALNVNAKAWAGPLHASTNYTLDALHSTVNYGGPWYLPSDCERLPAPSDAILGDGVDEVSSDTSGNEDQWGHVDGFAPGSKAWILSTGNVSEAAVNDPSHHASSDMSEPGSDSLSDLVGGYSTFDAAAYRVRLVPHGDELHIRYVFASEEYPEYVGAGYDDVMAVFVDGVNCALVPGTGTRVSVDSVNEYTNSGYYVDNSTGAAGYATSMDGMTVPLTCTVPVTPGEAVDVEVAVADVGDSVFDSAVGLLDKGIWSD